MSKRIILATAGLLMVVGLPLAGKWARSHSPPECAHDGLPIEAIYRVRIDNGDGSTFEFCCVQCAEQWLEQQSCTPVAINVTDEAGGGEIDARFAHFVQSSVVTNPVTGNRIHAFRDRSAAEEHARAYRGWELHGTDRPLDK